MTQLADLFNQTLMITGFVFVMMLVIEYVNVLTSGAWQQHLTQSRWRLYALAALLGVTPGCLGAFAVVAMYSHRMISLGSVVAAMIATSGDEAFVMLAMFPKEALMLHGLLFVIGIASGFLTDMVIGSVKTSATESCDDLAVHTLESCHCFPRGHILAQWKSSSPFRTILSVVLLLFLFAMVTGNVGPPEWDWVRVTVLFVTSLALFVVITVPDHFLEEHLWNHVARKHVPRVFIWTLGALSVIQVLIEQVPLEGLIRENLWAVLGAASLVGLIPESGPHMVFVMLFAKGTIPFSILLASSIVQDGHGMLPMLAHSRKAFFLVKLVGLAVGLTTGAVLLLFGVRNE